ncbi:hypothetical protein AciM339_0554 [Aciduliprofundum sp. MAR08-339]|uniref:hypothetical protein n=1 Tax=Aciduliprofundum sp. (strain MAR08-339) TaxID=673860 RepID=UPI0002A4C717|nr:hypothetical protein AciM339_0554 [Aciduliprofundum sp. MAR08-339]
MYWDWTLFLEIILSLVALTFLILGALTAYFGSGKSRAAGITLFIVGIIIPIIMYFVKWRCQAGYFTNNILVPGLLYIGGALIGIIIGFLVFLGIIMKT